MRNNSSFEILNALLYFGMQKKSRLEASIIIKMPDMQTKNSNALNLKGRRLLYCLLLVSMTETHGLSFGKPLVFTKWKLANKTYRRKSSCI